MTLETVTTDSPSSLAMSFIVTAIFYHYAPMHPGKTPEGLQRWLKR
jgi:hypothetical protein